ncbi:MAG: EI24 domain-containing protein [Rhizobacter sp.]|nr:EI24 domain-containing protein [Rhizobacter sp.]
MKPLFDSAWRAAAYCVHPVVIFLSLLPLVLMVALAFGLGYFFWEPAIDAVLGAIRSWELLAALSQWLDGIGMSGAKLVLAPMIVVFLSLPVLVVLSLLSVALLMAPAMLKLVARRRFAALEQRRGGSFAGSLFVSLSATAIALVALVVSIPFWLIPPVVLVVPPLIWGWLTYRVMSYDMLADHATKEERRELVRRHRPMLLLIGIVTGYLGAAPSLLWVSGAMFLFLAPVLVPLAIWIYTLVFAFSALWFAHYSLSALQTMRAETAAPDLPATPAIDAPAPMLPLPPL